MDVRTLFSSVGFGTVVPLADDFLSEQPGPITEVHIWGSWLNDYLPADDPGSIDFFLTIYKDIPADESDTGYSMPGETLWEGSFFRGNFETRLYAENLEEGWYDPYPPSSVYEPSGDTQCWQYNFKLDEGGNEPFIQEGTATNPIVYWLGIRVQHSMESEFGWKTSEKHWNDDAVWWIGSMLGTTVPGELRYPDSHPLQGESIDLAFVVVPEPATHSADPGRAGVAEAQAVRRCSPRAEVVHQLPACPAGRHRPVCR